MANNKSVKLLRKFVVLVTGVPLVILGIILIPLPGPGLLVSFIGLFVLALEFEWAAKHRDRLRHEAKKTIKKAQDRANKINKQ